MRKYQIFISYRRDGGEALGQLLFSELRNRGYEVFFDVESLRSGKFNEELFRVIDDCSYVLVVLPPGGLDRCVDEDDWVRKEIAYAIKSEKDIIPVMMRGFQFPEQLPDELEHLRYYNGIEANMQFFQAVMDKLTEQFIEERPAGRGKKGKKQKRSKASKLANFIIGILMLLLPVLLKHIYSDTWAIPGFLKAYLERIIESVEHLPVIYFFSLVMVVLMTYYELGGDADYISDKHREKNLSERDFAASPNRLLRKIILITNAQVFSGNTALPDEAGNDAYKKQFKGMDICSHDGERIDYFFLHQEEWHADLRVLLIGAHTIKSQAIKLLAAQQFNFCESDGRILRFEKNHINVRLAYDNWGYSLRGIEICSKDADSELALKTQKDKEESFETVIKRLKPKNEDEKGEN